MKSFKEFFAEATSSPGRVKRAGASCKGSVTELRKRAKKYGGEKGKMYHWCANMKSGKNIHMDATQGIYMKSSLMKIQVDGQWTETSQNKTQSTGAHVMNSETTALDGATSVTETGGRIDLN